MRLTKIYTKVGDKGQTMLANGATVPKDSPRIEAYGTVDELNAFIGQLADRLKNLAAQSSASSLSDLEAPLRFVQNELFDLGGELATPLEALQPERQQVVDGVAITRLESEIDLWNVNLEPLANFVLPGGHELNSLAHICRTICRRAERRLWALARSESVRAEPRIYLNRLSDWLFVLGRVLTHRLGGVEVLWNQRRKGQPQS